MTKKTTNTNKTFRAIRKFAWLPKKIDEQWIFLRSYHFVQKAEKGESRLFLDFEDLKDLFDKRLRLIPLRPLLERKDLRENIENISASITLEDETHWREEAVWLYGVFVEAMIRNQERRFREPDTYLKIQRIMAKNKEASISSFAGKAFGAREGCRGAVRFEVSLLFPPKMKTPSSKVLL